ncbi:MAG: serine/threonine-protein kinase, partial [Thermoanaerobaculia bacterium]
AMGVVYLARDPLIGRLVALKTFRIGYSVRDQELEQFRIRFMREAQSAGILSHPNIVTIHDVVEQTEEGLAFIAMEYVRGTTLKALLQSDQPMSLQFIVDIVAQVAEALDYAHAHRVIHRDVKPANILLTADNRVKITDFGIARLDTSNLTQEGQLLGTPNYMAPEQIQGREIDHRADLFALGVVLYEMLTRHKPFQGENLTVVSHRIVYDHFTPPRDYVRDLPPGMDRVLSRALEKDPAKRYQRAKEMIEDLRQLASPSVRGGDLNETQSLSSTLVLPPSAAPPPPPAGDGTAAAAPGGDLADTLATAAPAPPPARRSTPSRLLAVAALAAVLSLLFWTGALLWTRWSAPPAAADLTKEERQARILDLINQGRDAESIGNWQVAAARYGEALKLDPGAKGVQKRFNFADRQSKQVLAPADLSKRIANALAMGRDSMAVKNWDQVIMVAEYVLSMDAYNAEASQMLKTAQEAKLAAGKRPAAKPRKPGRPGEEVAATTPATSAEPSAPAGEEPAAAAASTATIQVHYQADMEGSLILRLGKEEVFRKNYSRSFFGRMKKGEGFEDRPQVTVPAKGTGTLTVQVTPSGKAADVKPIPVDLRGGSSHSLVVYLSKNAQVSVQFN